MRPGVAANLSFIEYSAGQRAAFEVLRKSFF